jgi:T4 bacteriophage base plate protein
MLPKIDYPVNAIKVPSTGKSIKFRPFLVKEEKLLLMAKESNNESDILHAIKQVVNNCSTEPKFDVDSLTIFDVEYVFLKLRSMSVDNKITVSYKDFEDEKVYEFEIDLNQVEVDFPKDCDKNIKISSKSGILLKYPSASLYDDKEFMESDKEYLFELIVRCIDKIYEGDNIYESKDYKLADLRSFIENIDIKTFEKIKLFLVNLPKLKHVIKYKNSLGNDREIVLTSLTDFFTLR